MFTSSPVFEISESIESSNRLAGWQGPDNGAVLQSSLLQSVSNNDGLITKHIHLNEMMILFYKDISG
ncbi:hypothetical protein ACOSP7_028564 [Xanthoceras sorbifolium]